MNWNQSPYSLPIWNTMLYHFLINDSRVSFRGTYLSAWQKAEYFAHGEPIYYIGESTSILAEDRV